MPENIVLSLWGPNLDQLGSREPAIYGSETLADHVAGARKIVEDAGWQLEHLQSASETELISAVLGARNRCKAIVVNAGALTHYGWGLHDALAMFEGYVVEVHLSQVTRREPWRHTSVIAPVSDAIIAGFGAAGFRFAIQEAVKH